MIFFVFLFMYLYIFLPFKSSIRECSLQTLLASQRKNIYFDYPKEIRKFIGIIIKTIISLIILIYV